MEENSKKCPYCAESIHKDAVICKHCGAQLDNAGNARVLQPSVGTTIIQQQPERKWSPGVAAVLSLVIPGAGQLYKGHIGRGLFWLVITIVGYCFFILPGIILHLLCIVTAASGDPYK